MKSPMKRNKTVLIVEDDDAIVNVLRDKLVRDGLTVRTAKNGREGLRTLLNDGIDLAVVDLLMPEMDGWEMLRKYRSERKRDGMPVLIFTNAGDVSEGPEELTRLGVVDVVIKAEMSLSEVAKKVEDLLKRP